GANHAERRRELAEHAEKSLGIFLCGLGGLCVERDSSGLRTHCVAQACPFAIETDLFPAAAQVAWRFPRRACTSSPGSPRRGSCPPCPSPVLQPTPIHPPQPASSP